MTLQPMNIRKGDLVWWRGSFGTDGWKQTKVIGIERVEDGQKYGDAVESVLVHEKDNCVFDLSTGNWAYGYQIAPVAQQLDFNI